jgi:endonuclease/exonuclease/phosphatase family metal-dependent hydrolase
VLIPSPAGGTTKFSRELLEVHLDIRGWRVVVFAAHFRSKFNDDPDRRLAEAMAAREIAAATAAQFPGALVVLGGDLNDTPGSPPLDALEAGGALSRVASDMPPGSDWTYTYFDDRLALDHLYLLTGTSGAYVAGSAVVVRYGSPTLGDSDHAGLRATFERLP